MQFACICHQVNIGRASYDYLNKDDIFLLFFSSKNKCMDELLHAKKVTFKIMFNFDFMLTLDYLDNEIHIP